MAGTGGPAQARRRARRAAARIAPPKTTPRLEVRDALVASGDAPGSKLLTTYDLTYGSPAENHFYARALEAGFTETRSDRWPCEIEQLEGGTNVVFRNGDHDHVYKMPDGTIAHLTLAWDMMRITVAGATAKTVDDVCFAIRDAYPASYMVENDDTRIPITFWSDSPFGPQARLRKIESAKWDDITANYTAEVRDQLAGLMAWDGGPAEDGQLLLWQGPPGTGKTWGLRALASQWASWAEFHYITDPDAFFVSNPSYMVDVLLSDSYQAIEASTGDVYSEEKEGGKWRVLILEDTGELLSANAKEQYGQGLSRLLNVVDGMIGQGLRVLALVTTNDELGDLHPAVARPGRCASQIEFGPLTADEAAAWLGEPTDEGGTVAELYARSHSGAEAFADADDGVNAPVEGAETGTCECGDPAGDHAGEMNDGACSVEGCDCGAFKEAAVVAGATQPDLIAQMIAPEGTYEFDPHTSTLTFRFESFGGVLVAEGNAGTVPNGESNYAVKLPDVNFFSTDYAGATNPDMPDVHREQETLPPVRPHPDPPPGGGDESEDVEDEVDEPETDDDVRAEEAEEDEVAGRSGMRWTATIAPEGIPTDDGRIFAPDAIKWRDLPLSLGAMLDTPHADVVTASPVVGRIDKIYRSGEWLMAEGVFDDSELGREIARMVADGTLRGVSVDLAISKMEVAYKSDILDEHGVWKGGDSPAEGGVDMLDILFGGEEEEVMFVIWEGTIGAVTICPFPAFADARIEVAKSLVASTQNPMVWTSTIQHGMVIVASAEPPLAEAILASAVEVEDEVDVIPTHPPRWCFENPEFDAPTALTVDGFHVYGHGAIWGVCHIGIPGVCTEAPNSASDYAYFHLKEVECDDGEVVSCGTITLDTGHAARTLGRVDTAAHYDNTGTAVADIVCGEDDHGIWFSGALRPGLDEDTIRKLRGSVLSGDWRATNRDGNLELVALLAVNVPGFPVPRTRAMVAAADGEPHVVSLVAAGICVSDEVISAHEAAKFAALADIVDGKFDGYAERAQEAVE